MTKTKIGVQIHQMASENEALLRVVANVNSGEANITIRDIMGYLDTRQAMWPFTKLYYRHETNELHISENGGKTFSLSLTWKEVHELKSDPADLKDTLNGLGETDREVETELNRNK